MKLYNTVKGVVIERNALFYLVNDRAWDDFVNDDELFKTMEALADALSPVSAEIIKDTLAPIGARQELWACGVTYLKSKVGRQEESKKSGAAEFYEKVYEAPRPEVFFKSNPHRIVGNRGKVNIRKDSTWDVPEPELTLLVTSSGKITGYTIGNDMSSRSIEGENPLYLPQAKTFDNCAALGPCIFVTENQFANGIISLEIKRNNDIVFRDTISTSQMKRSPDELVEYVFRECSFPYGCLIMTGTGIVPGAEFSLRSGDEIAIAIDRIGVLVNVVN